MLNKPAKNGQLMVNDEQVEAVEDFCYSGSILENNRNCCKNVRIAKANMAFSKLNNTWILARQKVGTTNEDSAVHLHSYLLNIKWCIRIYQPRWTVGPHHIHTVYSNTYWASYDCRHSAGDYTPGHHQVGCNGYRWCWSYIPTYGTSNSLRINHDKPLVLIIYPPYSLTRTEHLTTTYSP